MLTNQCLDVTTSLLTFIYRLTLTTEEIGPGGIMFREYAMFIALLRAVIIVVCWFVHRKITITFQFT
jgi:hypothetical protein